MKWILTIAAASLMIAASLYADEPKNGMNPDYKNQVHRLGDKVMRVGTIQAGPINAANEALMQMPADDSAKFAISVLVSDNPVFKPGCDALLQAFSTAEQLLSLVNLDDLRKSWFLPQVRKFEDREQKQYFDPLRPYLFPTDNGKPDGKPVSITDANGKSVPPFPAIIIRPPHDGSYGDDAEVVTIIFGFNGDVKSTHDRIQKATDEWMQTHAKGGARAASDDIEAARPGNQWADPFTKPVPMPPVGEFDGGSVAQWPAKRFNKPTPLTARQVKDLVPDAPQEFRLEMLEREVSDANQVQAAWIGYQREQLKAEREKLEFDRKPLIVVDDEQPLQPRHEEPETKAVVAQATANPTQGEMILPKTEPVAISSDGASFIIHGLMLGLILVALPQAINTVGGWISALRKRREPESTT